MAINAEGTRILLKAAADRGWRGTFLLASSAQVYARAPNSEMPLTEGSAVGPDNAYSRSKLEAEQIATGFASDSIRVLIARPFNHVGPGQSSRFAIPGFLGKIEAARRAGRREFTVGDLSASKDFTDVRDVVEAYRILLESSRDHDDTLFNICSGEAVSMKQVVHIAQEVADAADFTCHSDPGPRAGDPLFMQGRAEPLAGLGWRRKIPLRQSIADTYADLIRTGGEAA
jgi:GDP-4-dehydro-6-deoxy-D-mannose reductase